MTSQTPRAGHGVIALRASSCTSCMICARECPDWCIEIDAHQEVQGATGKQPGRAGRTRTVDVLDSFVIDFGLCMYCGICIEVCPHDALFWSPEATPVERGRADLRQDEDRLGTWLRSAPAAADTTEGESR